MRVRSESWSCILGALAFLGCGGSSSAGVKSVSTAVYNRVDTDSTIVWAPRVAIAADVNDAAGLSATVSMDAWTGASVDVVTAATQPVTELRKEVTAGGYFSVRNATIAAGYRFSTENDYWSNGGVMSVTVDMADKNSTLALALFGSRDIVGRAGDTGFARPLAPVGGRLSLTQILGRQTVGQLSWETTHVAGYQAGPYRFVAIGGDGVCAGDAPNCLPEVVPGLRWRHAAVGRIRQAIGDHLSVGAEYRFYFDSWGLHSHTGALDVACPIADHALLRASYRRYAQSKADFYQSTYDDNNAIYFTRDRELSPLNSNRLALEYLQLIPITDAGTALRLGLSVAGTRYKYLDFIGLDEVDAVESTVLLGMEFP